VDFRRIALKTEVDLDDDRYVIRFWREPSKLIATFIGNKGITETIIDGGATGDEIANVVNWLCEDEYKKYFKAIEEQKQHRAYKRESISVATYKP
jgi:hypothetical protein